jgi:putative protein kinase ArgK-like GTPase of G3E family
LTAEATSPVLEFLKTKKVIVLLGAGGVGKTTSAIMLAMAAARVGRKVALLSIDPAKRLAEALGMPLGSQLRRLALPSDAGITGTTCPGRDSCAGAVRGSPSNRMVRDRSAAEIPVLMPSLASTVTA